LLGVAYSSCRVKQVYEQETGNRIGVIEMKNAMQNLKNKMNDLDVLPQDFIRRINRLEENLRFVSPSNKSEAHELERIFVQTANDMAYALSDFSTNKERIEIKLTNLESFHQQRKNSYSI